MEKRVERKRQTLAEIMPLFGHQGTCFRGDVEDERSGELATLSACIGTGNWPSVDWQRWIQADADRRLLLQGGR